MEIAKVIAARERKRSASTSRWSYLRATWGYYIALIPTLILLAIFGYYPAISGLYHAFYDWHPGFDSTFIGWQNFVDIFHDAEFGQSLQHVLWLFLFGITVAWIFPMLAAELVITLSNRRLQFFFRTLLIAPFAFPMVVQVFLWGFLYDPNVGIINTIFKAIGLGFLAHNWLGDPNTALYAIMFFNAPWIASLPFLIFLAGLQGIQPELFDAMVIDGANRWQRFLSLDLPLLAPQFMLLLIVAIIQILQVGAQIGLLTNGGPGFATNVPILYMLDTAFVGGHWGYAAALSAALFFIIFSLSALVLRIQRIRNI